MLNKTMPLWKWILLFLASLLLSLIFYAVAQSSMVTLDGPAAWGVGILLAAGMLGLYDLFVRWFEKGKPKDLPLRRCAVGTGMGLLTGVAFFVCVVGVMYAISIYRVEGVCVDWRKMADIFFLYLVVAVGEEIIFRGVLFRWIDERFGFWWALGISGLVFGLAHIFNDGATIWSSLAIALEAGVMLGAAYKYSGNLWFPIGIHWAWNFTQGTIFGFAVSGTQVGYSLLMPDIDGPVWLTGGAFGAEASPIAAVIGLALAIHLIYASKDQMMASS